MTAIADTRDNVLLVGSVGLRSAEEVLRTVSGLLGKRLKRIPDGETGERAMWVVWPRRVLDESAAFELDPVESEAGGRITSPIEGTRRWVGGEQEKPGAPPPPRLRLRAGIDPATVRLGRLGYADVARESYAIFRRLRDEERIIPAGVRFQVALPTTAAFLNAHVIYRDHAAVEPLYRARLIAEVGEMAHDIPNRDLAIQWDVSTEMGQWEGVRHAHFADVKPGVLDRLALHCNAVPEGVELGIHLCYGSYGHRHWMEPKDTANMVAVYNGLAGRVGRRIDWLHMPVPRDRADDAYYAPLRDLNLRPETELYLGLVHLTDGVAGTERRRAVASKYIAGFGLATECGFGRRPPETIPDLLRLHAAL